MSPKLPRHVRRKTAKGREYLYFDTGRKDERGKPILSRLPGLKDPAFGRALADAERGRTMRDKPAEPGALTVNGLADLYEKSVEFRELAKGTQELYLIYIKQIREKLDGAPAEALTARHVRLLRDKKMADKPGAANVFVATLGAIYKWGREAQYVTNFPTRGIRPLATGEHDPWPTWLLEQALIDPDPAVREPVAVLYYTALRIGDGCKVRWSDIRKGVIVITPQKTRKKNRSKGTLHIPVHRELAAILGPGPDLGDCAILHAYKPDTHRAHIQKWAEARAEKVVPHGLRKNAVNALLECGCSVAETASISGQTLALVEHYAKQRDQAKLGRAAMANWERK